MDGCYYFKFCEDVQGIHQESSLNLQLKVWQNIKYSLIVKEEVASVEVIFDQMEAKKIKKTDRHVSTKLQPKTVVKDRKRTTSSQSSSSRRPSQQRSKAKPQPVPSGSNAARERSRVKTLRMAFMDLQRSLPAVPRDTKLSKLDVLVLATTYIAHLTRALSCPTAAVPGHQATGHGDPTPTPKRRGHRPGCSGYEMRKHSEKSAAAGCASAVPSGGRLVDTQTQDEPTRSGSSCHPVSSLRADGFLHPVKVRINFWSYFFY